MLSNEDFEPWESPSCLGITVHRAAANDVDCRTRAARGSGGMDCSLGAVRFRSDADLEFMASSETTSEHLGLQRATLPLIRHHNPSHQMHCWLNVCNHPVATSNSPLSKRPTSRLGCIAWFNRGL